MKPDRIAFALLTAGSIFLTALAQGDAVNAKTAVILVAAAQAASGLLRVLWPTAPTPGAQ